MGAQKRLHRSVLLNKDRQMPRRDILASSRYISPVAVDSLGVRTPWVGHGVGFTMPSDGVRLPRSETPHSTSTIPVPTGPLPRRELKDNLTIQSCDSKHGLG